MQSNPYPIEASHQIQIHLCKVIFCIKNINLRLLVFPNSFEMFQGNFLDFEKLCSILAVQIFVL
jgi:hypothetical protein